MAWASDHRALRPLGLLRARRYNSTPGDLFRLVVRSGRRAGSRTLVVHLLLATDREATPLATTPTVGFVVSRAVGNAVRRNTVKRRLRHLSRDRLSALPAGTLLVVRALPTSTQATYAALGADLDRALEKALARATT